MKVTNEIKVYELNGGDTAPMTVAESNMQVLSHWNFTDRVVLKYGDFTLTVLAEDLRRAIKNAENH